MTSSHGADWTVSNLVGTFRAMGLTPQLVDPEPGADLRMIAVHDPAAHVNFGAIYQAAERETVRELAFLCMLPCIGLTEERAREIGEKLAISVVFLEEGQLWIYAEPDQSRDFTEAGFRTQVGFYISDVRMAVQLLTSSSALAGRTMAAFKDLKLRRGVDAPMVRALSNDPDDRTHRANRAGRMLDAGKTCRRCGGTGRRFLSKCGICDGKGRIT